MNKAYNPTWFPYNELSQITPMPKAWDRTASGPEQLRQGRERLRGRLQLPGQPVQGPVDLRDLADLGRRRRAVEAGSFNPDGNSTFVPNKAYSGPVKPTLAEFKEVPFTTEAPSTTCSRRAPARPEARLRVPARRPTRRPSRPTPRSAPTRCRGYTLVPLYPLGDQLLPGQLRSTTGNGPVIKQLYFRQALQSLMNQRRSSTARCTGTRYTDGPVGAYPATSSCRRRASNDPFPFNPAKAKSLLASHGWKVTPNGVTTCQNPSLCGAGSARARSCRSTCRTRPALIDRR